VPGNVSLQGRPIRRWYEASNRASPVRGIVRQGHRGGAVARERPALVRWVIPRGCIQITGKLATLKAYRAVGFTEKQADAMAEQHESVAEEIHRQLTDAMTAAVSNATQPLQANIERVQANIEKVQAHLEAAIARATAEQTRFTITVGAIIVGILGLMMTAYRFFQ
jgi:hypothetical protein